MYKRQVVPRVSLGAVLKSMRAPCLVSLCVSWFIVQIPSLEPQAYLTSFAASLVTGVLLLLILAPHVEWSLFRSAKCAANHQHVRKRNKATIEFVRIAMKQRFHAWRIDANVRPSEATFGSAGAAFEKSSAKSRGQ